MKISIQNYIKLYTRWSQFFSNPQIFEFGQKLGCFLGIHLFIRIFIHLITFNIHGMLMILIDLMAGPWCLMSLMTPSHPASDAKPRAWQGRLWTNTTRGRIGTTRQPHGIVVEKMWQLSFLWFLHVFKYP